MNRSSFNNLIFNPIDISDNELVEQGEENDRLYSALGGDKGFLGDEARHKDIGWKARLMRYTLVLYDKESPLWMTHPDVVGRKKQAALIAGFDIEKQKETLDGIFNLRDYFLSKSITAFIRYQHNYKLGALISNEQVLYEIQDKLMNRMTDFKDDKQLIDHYKVKTHLSQQQNELLEMIENYKREIWRDDEVAYEKTMDLEFDIRTTPEKISKIKLNKPRIKGLNR